ncbi:MAG: sigma-70 family RNA polymerase sigma factor [Planctomycetaceae bacterium]|jgi:RNA polymerase sigma-70 factor (ECF subfamily)|nr:sigma-70 family RNA polymerase sigma factor [Planctomycetaceae bacterium]
MSSDFSAQPDLALAEDAHLVSLVRCGSREAFDEIDRRYRKRLCRYLCRHTNGAAYAEEIAQQTLIRAFEMIEQLKFGEKIGAWLYRIAYRLLVDDSRRKRKLSAVISDSIAVSNPAADALIAEEEKASIWKIARQTLTQDEFIAIELRYVEDFNIAEIAKIMSRTQISVRVILYRARNRLLPHLAEFSQKNNFQKQLPEILPE